MDSTGGTMLKSNEWWTPPRYIEAARSVLGGIDLDPASCEMANQTVQATRFYDKDSDGLAQPWYGRVYLNPPYSRENMPRGNEYGNKLKSVMYTWIEHLIREYHYGDVTAAILLTKADPKQIWFQLLWQYPICFVSARLLFNRPGLPPERHQFGNAFVYFGHDTAKFIDVFTEFGNVIHPDCVHGQKKARELERI
jgi:DNA N-6-adenine-methyltransferase (Dam)